MKYIVSVSGGLSSFEALCRTIAKHGRENTVGIFADVGEAFDELGNRVCGEDEDLYRFLKETERVLDFPILRVKNPSYANIWDVFFKERMLGSTLRDPCSKMLKRRVVWDYIKKNFVEFDTVLVMGFSFLEADRAFKFEKHCEYWKTWMPLLEAPFFTNDEIGAKLLGMGVKQPRLYDEGFIHNNCGGFCVKMGLGQAHDLWRIRPAHWLWHEGMELKFRSEINPEVTIFRKSEQPITMRDLRGLFEGGYVPKTAGEKHGCGGRCMVPEPGEIENELAVTNQP